MVWVRLPCCLLKSPLKLDFLDNYLTTYSESVNAEIQNLSGSSFFSNCSKFNLNFKKAAKIQKKFFVSEIIASELVSLNCLYEEEDTCHRQPMC